jgi:hypothetical protein
VQSVVWLLIGAGLVSLLAGMRRPLGAAPATASTNRERRNAAWAMGALWTTFGVIASCKPVSMWHGHPIRLPQSYVASWLGIERVLRVPSRLGVAALMGIALLAGVAFVECAERLPQRSGGRLSRVLPLILALIVAGAAYQQYTRQPDLLPRSYPIAATVASTPGLVSLLARTTGPVLELPTLGPFGKPSPVLQTHAMYRSIWHWRPLLNGYSSYFPAGFPERMELANQLPEPQPPRGREPRLDAGMIITRLERETGVGAIVVHLQELRRRKRRQWLELANRGAPAPAPLRFVGRDGDDLVFAIGASLDP